VGCITRKHHSFLMLNGITIHTQEFLIELLPLRGTGNCKNCEELATLLVVCTLLSASSLLLQLPTQYIFNSDPIHYSLSAVMHAPFHASVLRPASQVGPMHEAAEMGTYLMLRCSH